MVYRVYTEKKDGFTNEADACLYEIRETHQINSVKSVRILNRYDVEKIDETLFKKCIPTVFSEPVTDEVYFDIPQGDFTVFAVEYLPGQFDQRADSCEQCIQFVSGGERPRVRTAKVYLLEGNIDKSTLETIQKFVINPVESRIAELKKPQTLEMELKIPEDVPVLDGFLDFERDKLTEFIDKYGLAMDIDDIQFCQQYFKSEKRCPTLTEIRMIDTYWSDHCRHTTFSTILSNIDIDDKKVENTYKQYLTIRNQLGISKPITLMDMATIGAKYLKSKGLLNKLDESDEINACTVKIKVDVDGKDEDWLFLFKNETHNHPTEIEPFGGAATCIGGAIRDPLSGRAYVYQAMRITGAADPTVPADKTLEGKLSQRKIVTTAAAGYSSYGNQIGLATGLVDEIYHDGYIAKHMELGAVVGAVPCNAVKREVPVCGDVVVLLGGKTGRDGCGGATGSSKSHNLGSLESCGAEVQKGNAPIERKLQRLFRNPDVTKLIKRCNDFGAGGVSVAIGELADGLDIDLDKVTKKYEGLDGTELAISESQERMAVVLDKSDIDQFKKYCDLENLEATVVATITDAQRLRMSWRGKTIVDVSRAFLNTNGAKKYADVHIKSPENGLNNLKDKSFGMRMQQMAGELSVCSRRGLSERFDSTIGAGTVLMPFGGKYQRTPSQCMAAMIPVLNGQTTTCSVMSYGFNPFISEQDPYRGAYLAVVESVSKIVAAGAYGDDCYLTFQEYFERLRDVPERWGKPAAALLGALKAQLDLKIASIGGKDSMSGSFENIDVPPTLVSFAVSICKADNVVSPEFKNGNSKVILLCPDYDKDGLPVADSLLKLYNTVTELIHQDKVYSVYTPVAGGIAEAIMKMSFGNHIGFEFDSKFDINTAFRPIYGSFIIELKDEVNIGTYLGKTIDKYEIKYQSEVIGVDKLESLYEQKLEKVYPANLKTDPVTIPTVNFENRPSYSPKVSIAKPKVLIPVFPGTNCEYDTARVFEKAGAKPEIFVINNLNAKGILESAKQVEKIIRECQIIMLPGGFSGGDEPDGSGKFITAFFRNPAIKDAVHDMLYKRDGLMGGICNGFQALIKLGLVPFGEIIDIEKDFPTLTYNKIARHQSKLVRTRVASVNSPWLLKCSVGNIHTVAISHGEGRFVCDEQLLYKLKQNGQIATQYVDLNDKPTMDIQYNPNGSDWAVEGIFSPDGRVFGKMGHSERIGKYLYKNINQDTDNHMFESAVEYFKI